MMRWVVVGLLALALKAQDEAPVKTEALVKTEAPVKAEALVKAEPAVQTEPAAKAVPAARSGASLTVNALSQGSPEEESTAQLSRIRRIFVDLLTGGESALKIRDLLVASLQSTRLFIVTEDEDKADAVLKGAGEDTVFTESFQSSEGLTAHAQLDLPSTGSTNSRYSGRTSSNMSISENDSRHKDERKHEAIATVRLVSKEGDVIWSTTQESFGGKFMGAASDVADKVAKKLAADIRRSRRPAEAR